MIDKPTDIKILRAFIGTLAELDSLDEAEQEQLREIGEYFKKDPNVAVHKLHKFALNNESRKKIYEEVRVELQKDYQQQTRTKITLTLSNASASDSNDKEVDNVSLSTDALGSLESLQTLLEADSVERAKQLKEKLIQTNELKDKPRWQWVIGLLFRP
ncbi:MAG: hypothetical protein F6K32_11425 [Desertifilum sp. SIO1I2]|nr:hypothetical protein [Desertifilum sp. SIO1I2]